MFSTDQYTMYVGHTLIKSLNARYECYGYIPNYSLGITHLNRSCTLRYLVVIQVNYEHGYKSTKNRYVSNDA